MVREGERWRGRKKEMVREKERDGEGERERWRGRKKEIKNLCFYED